MKTNRRLKNLKFTVYSLQFTVFLFFSIILPVTGVAQVYLDSTASVSARVDDLLGRMTLNEKIGQMVQTERNYENVNSVIYTYYLGSILSGGGSTPGTNTAADWINMYNDMQDAALGTRLGIPIIYGIDAVHGNNNVFGATIFPHNIGMGCTRDSLLVLQCARATAMEVKAVGLNWTFSPCIAVPRNIKWGRTYEGFGETPELQEMMASASTYGYQGDTLGSPGGILACAKHLAGDGGTSGGTDRGNTLATEPVFRQIHLPGYGKAVDAGVGSVMVSYSSWNGVACSTNKHLITDILKGEMGFQGFVVSDWDAIHALGGDYKTNIGIAVNAGIDMFMEPYTPVDFINNMIALVNAGTVSQNRINDAVRRILTVKFQMHLFEHPYASMANADSLGCAAHRTLARQAVRESMVLLKNDANTLPLSKVSGKILITGTKASDIGSQCGGWTITWQGGTGSITPGTTIFYAIKTVRGAENVVYSTTGSTLEAVDVAVVAVGESPYAEGQGDSQNPTLNSADLAIIAKVQQLNIPYVILLISGRPLILNDVLANADAVVACWLPGTEAMGITDVLFGDYDFTGKLSHTWPSAISQEPINWGDANYQPLFPYGYGLSYANNGVPSMEKGHFSVYPNPAEDILTVCSDYSGTLSIFDLAGKIMLQQETQKQTDRIDISALPAGVYVVSFTDKSGTYRVKMVKY